jgi:uncharacterized membrane protein
VAQIARSIDLDAPVDTVHEEWLRFEELPRSAAQSLVANVRWRAEVLTLKPTRSGTRITFRVEYDASGGEAVLPSRLDSLLRSFASFFELRRGRVTAAQPA